MTEDQEDDPQEFTGQPPIGLQDFGFADWLLDLDQLGRIFSVVSLCCLFIYAVAVVGSALPLTILRPDWQIRFSTALINNSGFAVLGLCLAYLAATFTFSDRFLQARLDVLTRLAVVAALGFLFLIPLQTSAVWRSLNQAAARESIQLRRLDQQLASLRQVVQSAESAPELRSRLLDIGGPGLTDFELQQPSRYCVNS